MKQCIYNEVLNAASFQQVRSKDCWSWVLPIRKRYKRFLPKMAFAIGDDVTVLIGAPTVIMFRRRWSFDTYTRKVRLTYLVNDEKNKPYLKIYFV